MSLRTSQILRDPAPADGQGSSGIPAAPRRSGSVALREAAGTVGNDSSVFDPANQSLADSLKVMLGLLQVGMFVLGGWYALSGLNSVQEGKQAIRLLFGSKQGEALDPGLQLSAPYPLGELIEVDRGLNDVVIDKDFWVFVPDGTAEGTSVEKLMPTQSLKPDQGGSGSVLTADGNIAHTKWKVGYRRDDISKYAQNVLPTDEIALVRAAVKRGVVQACATVTIDELLKQSASQTASVAARAKAVAQRTLDSFQSGLVIDQLTLDQTIAPLWVRSDFAKVQSASADAAKVVDQAKSEGDNALNSIAGQAVPYLLKAIEAFEAAINRKDEKAQTEWLAIIDKLLLGEEVEMDGQKVPVRISGQITTMLAEAKRDRAAAVTTAKTALDRFNAKLTQFTQNPSVMVQQEWSGAVTAFMSRDSVQTVYVPENLAAIRLLLNADPDLGRAMDRAQKEREGKKAEDRRMEELRKERFKTQTGTTQESI
jgi:regulator of protease activity HflC (stomatin/prohibitin superfamily)